MRSFVHGSSRWFTSSVAVQHRIAELESLRQQLEALMRNRAAILGKEKGYSYGEGFDQIVVPG